jgi:hypothetical protein
VDIVEESNDFIANNDMTVNNFELNLGYRNKIIAITKAFAPKEKQAKQINAERRIDQVKKLLTSEFLKKIPENRREGKNL